MKRLKKVPEVKTSPFKGKVVNGIQAYNKLHSVEIKQETEDRNQEVKDWEKQQRLAKFNRRKKDTIRSIKNASIVIPMVILDHLRVTRNADVTTLYLFYCQKAYEQGTNQPWANESHCLKELGMGRDSFRRARAILIELKYVELLQPKKKSGDFGKVYTRINQVRYTDIRRPQENKALQDDSIKTHTPLIHGKPAVYWFTVDR